MEALAWGLRTHVYRPFSQKERRFYMASEETSLVDLIVAIGAETGRSVQDQREASLLLARMLWDLLHKFQPISGSWH
jgi:hypothetical protein